MPNRNIHTVKMSTEISGSAIILSDDFDRLVDNGVDDILIITPTRRYLNSIDEWFDYGYLDLDGDVECRVLHKAYLGAA